MADGSPEVDVIRNVYETWNRGDIGAFADTLHPEITWRTFDFDGQERTFSGRDEVRRFHEDVVSRTGWVTFEPVELIPVGDRVVAPLVSRSPEDDGGQAEMRLTALWTVRDGTPVAFRLFFDTDRALAAAQG